MGYTSVIFDLDGTLLDTSEDLTDSINYVLGKYGYPHVTADETKEYTGNSSARFLELSLPEGRSTEHFDEILREYSARYSKNSSVKTKPYPGMLETLEELKRRKIVMAIVSNKPDPAVKDLARYYFPEYITTAIGDTPNVPRKPAPDLVLRALESMNADKEQVLYIGDTEVDIETARNAGIKCVCVSWGFRKAELLRDCGADIIIDRPEELLKYL